MNKNDDIPYLYHQKTPHLRKVKPRLSMYTDLSIPWLHCRYDDQIWEDYDSNGLRMYGHNDLLIFTDGSNDEGMGGYGYLIIPGWLYDEWCFRGTENIPPHSKDTCSARKEALQPYIEKLRIAMEEAESTPWITACDKDLSHRCSIDYGEAYAVHDSIEFVAKTLKRDDQYDLDAFDAVRIISDSQVVLNYITGDYLIRDSQMKKIVDDIHWNTSTIMTCLSRTPVIFQKVKAHDKTLGNEYADILAGEGLATVRATPFHQNDYNPWNYISIKAVCNRAKRGIQYSLNETLWADIIKSRFGKALQQPPSYCAQYMAMHSWRTKYREDMSYLSRDSIRILLAIRTGHDHLRYHLHHMYGCKAAQSPTCPCNEGDHTMTHLLRDCRLAPVRRRCHRMRRRYLKWHFEYLRTLQPGTKTYNYFDDLTVALDFSNVLTFTDPPNYPRYIRTSILQLIVELYRMVTGYHLYQYHIPP